MFALNVTRALFDKSNSAREVREERGPEVVLVNFSANSINHLSSNLRGVQLSPSS